MVENQDFAIINQISWLLWNFLFLQNTVLSAECLQMINPRKSLIITSDKSNFYCKVTLVPDSQSENVSMINVEIFLMFSFNSAKHFFKIFLIIQNISTISSAILNTVMAIIFFSSYLIFSPFSAIQNFKWTLNFPFL